MNNDNLFQFYAGYIYYEVFLAFYEFLGPVIKELNYWGTKEWTDKQNY